MTDVRQPITLEELDTLAAGEMVEIPHWREGEMMWVRIRYVDVTPKIAAAVGEDQIPSPLRGAVDETFGDPPSDPTDTPAGETGKGKERRLLDLFDEIAREALVEPSYQQLEERGLVLTFAQQLALFEVVMGDLGSLESFRALTADAHAAHDSENAPLSAE